MNFWQYKTSDVPEKDVTPFGNVLHGINLVILPFFAHPMIDTCGLRRLNYSTTAGTIRWVLSLPSSLGMVAAESDQRGL
jgi:hypothetical protein